MAMADFGLVMVLRRRDWVAVRSNMIEMKAVMRYSLCDLG